MCRMMVLELDQAPSCRELDQARVWLPPAPSWRQEEGTLPVLGLSWGHAELPSAASSRTVPVSHLGLVPPVLMSVDTHQLLHPQPGPQILYLPTGLPPPVPRPLPTSHTFPPEPTHPTLSHHPPQIPYLLTILPTSHIFPPAPPHPTPHTLLPPAPRIIPCSSSASPWAALPGLPHRVLGGYF